MRGYGFLFFGVANPARLFRSVILQQIMGIEYQYHYRQFYPEISSHFSSYCSLYGADMPPQIFLSYAFVTKGCLHVIFMAQVHAVFCLVMPA